MSQATRVIRMKEPGPPDVLGLAERALPEAGPGELSIRVAASGLNRADLLQRLGRYPAPEGYPQDVPGMEFAGVVEGVGSPEHEEWIGRAVMGITGGGAYAERIVVPAEEVVRVPKGLDPVEAAAIPEVFMTAYDAVFLQGALEPGERLLIHAVGSGVGTAALQLGLRSGAIVVGTSRTKEKLERARAMGLHHAVVGDDRWPNAVRDAVGGGVDVVLDLVGGPYLEGNQRVLGDRGRHVVVGIPGGSKATLDLGLLMRKRAHLRGTVLRSRNRPEKVALARAFERAVAPGFEDGSLRPVVDRVFAAGDAADAHRYMEENRNFGKILLRW